MIVSHKLTLGQITFLLRVAIQILAYGGLFLIGLIVFGTAPRVASAGTHGLLNRIVGRSTATKTSIKWAFKYLRGKSGDPVLSTRFLVAILLLILYSAFTSISDVGFIGFYACTTGGSPTLDFPGSISTDLLAQAAVVANMINGTDPASVGVHRCDAAEEVVLRVNVTKRVCRAWHNSTYADPNVFKGLNTTDSDVLMVRYLKHNQTTLANHDFNSFCMSPGPQRVVRPVIANGLVVVPHQTGVLAVTGVPQLSPQQKVTISKTLAVESEMGCMALGVYSKHNMDDPSSANLDFYATNGTWRNYTGPDYFHDLLSRYVDDIRQLYLPSFNASSIDENGFIYAFDSPEFELSSNAAIQTFFLPGDVFEATGYMLGNCTNAVRQTLNITVLDTMEATGSCSFLAVTGSMKSEGNVIVGNSRMLCAGASQVNMVSATVETGLDGTPSVNINRLPSDLNHLVASYRDGGNDTTAFNQSLDIERFSLADNDNGLKSHFIPSNELDLVIRSVGAGAGGNVISRIAPIMLNLVEFGNSVFFAGLVFLDEGNNQIDFSSALVTRWGGQVGASFILNSMAYNGWAARDSSGMTVHSTGGQIATCYKPLFALAFLPLVLCSVFVMGWALVMIIGSTFEGQKQLKRSYGGLNPYLDAVYPENERTETLLAWQNEVDVSKPRLEMVSKEEGKPLEGVLSTALEHLKSRPSSL